MSEKEKKSAQNFFVPKYVKEPYKEKQIRFSVKSATIA
jgi:hypothetical protein